MDLLVDKGANLIATKYPAVALAVPVAKKFVKPLANKAHEGINKLFNKDAKEEQERGEADKPEAASQSPEKESKEVSEPKEEKEGQEQGKVKERLYQEDSTEMP